MLDRARAVLADPQRCAAVLIFGPIPVLTTPRLNVAASDLVDGSASPLKLLQDERGMSANAQEQRHRLMIAAWADGESGTAITAAVAVAVAP